MLGLAVLADDNPLLSATSPELPVTIGRTKASRQRKLQDGVPYLTNHIIHQQPYYSSGYAPFHNYGPLVLPPPSPMLAMPPMVPPPPPIFTSGQLPIQNAYHIIHHPQHMASPWNVNAFPHVFNPYGGHRWPGASAHPSSYGAMPYGLHPFSNPGVGYPYGMSPYYNPYMSMMAMGSMNPFLGGSMYPMSHIAGGYGMYGPNSPLNFGETANSNGGSSEGEDRPTNDASTMERMLKDNKKSTSADNSDDVQKLVEDLETSKRRLITSLEQSLSQLRS